jgi:hypothetical protein
MKITVDTAKNIIRSLALIRMAGGVYDSQNFE